MLKQIHFLLSYTCIYECDHCFLFSGPEAQGTFTMQQLRDVFTEIPKIGTVDTVYFEGGESFLFYPLLLEGIRLTAELDLKIGIVTNAYWATSIEDAEMWLRPLAEIGISDLSISDDLFHYSEEDNQAKLAIQAAQNLGLPVGAICIEGPQADTTVGDNSGKGANIVGGNVVFRGRAEEELSAGLPTRKRTEFTQCLREELEKPKRVHVDSYGNVHICQGLSMGNMWETPLAELVKNYDAQINPICGPLLNGGPLSLARKYRVNDRTEFIDECHMCYLTRKDLLDKFPQYLAPRQVYGLE